MKVGSYPIHTLSQVADYVVGLRAHSIYISDAIVCLLFLQVLPEEDDAFRQIIGRGKELLTIDGLMDKLRARFDLSREVKSRSSDTAALVALDSTSGKSGRAETKSKNMGKK